MGFEPTKHYASALETDPFDRSGKLAKVFLNRFSPILPDVGIEPTTTGLKVLRSTTELIGFKREMGFEPTTFGEIGLPMLYLLSYPRMVQAVGFEPTKHYALDLKANPFDRSGKLAKVFLNRFSPILLLARLELATPRS